MKAARRFVAAVFALESTALVVRASAQPPAPSPRSVAVDMYDAADALMASGRIREACPKYAESYRLDPQLGALLHWADCLEQDGKLASAYAAFRDAAELASRAGDRREEFALGRVRLLEKRLSRVILSTPKGPLPTKAAIYLDTLRIVESSLGVGIALDPGEHTVRASAPGFESFSTTFTVSGEGQVQHVEIPPLKAIFRPSPSRSASAPLTLSQGPAVERQGNETRKWIGVGVSGAGIVAIGVGAAFLADMLHLLDERDALCPRDPCSAGTDRSRVRALESDARRAQTWALGLSIGGVVAATAGLVLYLGSRDEPTALRAWQRRSAQSSVVQGMEWRF